jgi:hypothetical protein
MGFFSVDTEKDFCFVINSWSPEHLIIHKGVIKTKTSIYIFYLIDWKQNDW